MSFLERLSSLLRLKCIEKGPQSGYQRFFSGWLSLLFSGDCVIQNGGNSGVGLSVSQLAKAWGVHCISIIRDRLALYRPCSNIYIIMRGKRALYRYIVIGKGISIIRDR